jgi:threonyl-tRNA synthetase
MVKLLMWHCERLSYEDGKPSTLPLGIHEVPPTPTVGSYADVLVVFTTVEAGDDDSAVQRAVSEVRRMIKMIGSRPILVMPFAHLSNRLADPPDAEAAIARIGTELERSDLQVDVASFGFHKEEFRLSYVARAHEGSVAYREI